MRYLTAVVIALMLAAGMAWADRPAVVALSSATGVTVKLTETAGYKAGSGLSYEIRHWPDGERFAAGTVNAEAIKADAWGLASFTIDGLKPKLWSPQTPELYEISVSDSSARVLGKARFGFRTFEAKGDKLYLNGRPVFLRGVPINPPGRELPEAALHDPQYIRGYIKLLKSANVNMIRTEPQDWLDACDELGMMLFAGHYGGAGGKGPDAPAFSEKQPYYHDLVLGLASHPGVVIYVLSNEVDYKTRTSTYLKFLTEVREDIRAMDPTRPVIGNAGFGHGKPGEIFDVHRYAGWYYGSICDWYSDSTGFLAEARKANQPFTLTECVGAYTADSGDFETMAKQLCTMTKWVGTAKDPREAALEYQAELVRQVVEITRRYRTDATSIAGVMPFTYFLGWTKALKAEDLIIKPAFETLKVVFQPVLISPECWQRDLYIGDDLKMRLCLVNDDDSQRDLGPSKAEVDVVGVSGSVVASASTSFTATKYYSNAWKDLSIRIPAGVPEGYYDVRCKLVANGAVISKNSFQILVAFKGLIGAPSARVTLFDPSGDTGKALKQLQVNFRTVTDLKKMPDSGALVIGEGALTEGNYPDKASVLAFLDKGGRILCLTQDREKWNSDWLPAKFTLPSRHTFTYIQPVGGDASPIMNGLTDRDLRYWNDLGAAASGTPDIYPVVAALKPASVLDLRSARVWASCDQLLSSQALVELMHGSGSVVLSQFRAVERVSTDPAAAKLLVNLITYASGKTAGLLDLSKPIAWDKEGFRSGAFVSSLQGLLPHSPVYKHDGSSKGLLGADHRIDGFTLVGRYDFKSTGWLQPIPDPAAEGWGIFYGTLSSPATRFVLKLRNTGDTSAKIALKVDGKAIGLAQSVPAGAETSLTWPISHGAGPVEVELRGDQRLVITRSSFE